MKIALKEDLAQLFLPPEEMVSIYGEQFDISHISDEHDLVNIDSLSSFHGLIITSHPLGAHYS